MILFTLFSKWKLKSEKNKNKYNDWIKNNKFNMNIMENWKRKMAKCELWRMIASKWRITIFTGGVCCIVEENPNQMATKINLSLR